MDIEKPLLSPPPPNLSIEPVTHPLEVKIPSRQEEYNICIKWGLNAFGLVLFPGVAGALLSNKRDTMLL